MARQTIGPRIKVDGEAEYRSSMKNIISATKELDSELKATAKSFDSNGKAQNTNAQKVENLKKKIELQKKAISEANDMCEKAKQKYGEDSTQAQAYATKVNQLTAELNEMNNELKESGGTAFGAKLKDIGAGMKSFGKSAMGVGKTLTTYVTLPLVAFGTKAVLSFAEVDKTMQLTNKTMGNTEEEAELLNQAMKDAAANSTFGMNDAATASLNFARAGLNAEQAAASLAPAMNLAAGEGGDLDTVSAGLVATINGFHGSFDDAASYADVFAAACNNSALDVDSLSEAMSVAAPIFSTAGYSVEDAALYMGVMANNGIEASVAANSLKTGIARLVKPSKEGAEQMKKLGISVTNADGSMKDSVQIQGELHDAFSNLSESEQIAAASAIFGKNQMAPWLALINTAPDDVGALDESLRTCSGTTEEMANAMMSGFGGSLEKLKSSVDVASVSLGEALAPTIQKVADFVQLLVDKFNALSPEQQQMIAKIGLIVAAAGPLIMMLGAIATGLGALMSPIGLVVAAIAGITAVVGVLWAKNEGFRNAVTKIWEGLKETATTIWNTITGLFSGEITLSEVATSAWETLKSAASTIWEAIKGWFTENIDLKEIATTAWETAKSTASTIWEAIKGFFTETINLKEIATGVFDTAKGAAETAWNAVKDAWEGAPPVVKEIAKTAWENAKSAAETAWTTLKGKWEEAAPVVQSIATTAWDTAKEAATTAWENIKSAWEGAAPVIADISTAAFDAVKTAASDIWESIKEIFMSFDITWPDFGALASGALEGLKNAAKGAWDFVCGLFSGKDEQIDTSSVSGATAEMEQAFTEINLEISKVDVSSLDEANKYASDSIKSIERKFKNLKPKINNVDTSALTKARTFTTTTVTAIKTAVNTMKLTLPTVNVASLNTLKTAVTNAINTVKTTINTVSLKLPAVNAASLTTAKTAASTAASGIKTSINTVSLKLPSVDAGALAAAKSTASSAGSSIKSSINNIHLSLPSVDTSALDTAKTTVANKIAAIKGLMDFTWRLPKPTVPDMPHVTPVFSLRSSPDGKTKAYKVDWQTNWYDKGGVFYDPAVIGIAEKRPEFVGALDDLKEVVKSAMAESGSRQGTTFNQYNYSPKALSRLEIYRQTRNYVNFALG